MVGRSNRSILRGACSPALLLAASLFAANPAMAQQQAELSEGFRAQAERVKAAPSASSAQALADQARSPLEKYVAGAMMLEIVAGSNDLRAERKALSALFDSQAVPAGQLGKLHNQAGIISLMLNDPKDAIAQIRYADQLGYRDFDGQVALADALARTRDGAGSMTALDSAQALQSSARTPLSESWYDRAISIAAATNQLPSVALWGQRKVAAFPSERNWRSALMTYLTRPGVGIEEMLDVYRLAAARNALVTERDWLGYALAANNAGAFVEAKAALEAGISRGTIVSGDATITKQIALLAPKAKKQLAALNTSAAAAEKATKGEPALAVADDYYSNAQFAKAAEYYRLALSKGVTDKDRATTRLGISQMRNGDVPGGLALLGQVAAGPWAAVSGFWSITPTATASAAPATEPARP